ncbi:hypothetical protein pipiens_001723 [Culex pipiens pipiens]|uniref:DDE Tnp4 domain-containing protein n=1 Tax=Culex pipiens pipiens TaxID=38569 RepID=A0ABD1DXF2_CULPP
MTKPAFDLLLSELEPMLRKQDTFFRKAIEPSQRLALCLRYLITGDTIKNLSFYYRVGHSTAYYIVIETCQAIIQTLMHKMLPTPTTADWNRISSEINTIWNFPNCLGALDGKHITIQAPPNSGSTFFNYKKTFSVVLQGGNAPRDAFSVRNTLKEYFVSPEGSVPWQYEKTNLANN